jgi:uncharacterized YccA/Bax inhibitor family protein
MRSGNPTLNAETFAPYEMTAGPATTTMTVQGAATKTLILLGLCVGSACFTWSSVLANAPAAMPWIWGGAIGGLVFALITSFAPRAAGITAPLYALAEGLFLGGLTAIINARYPGIAMQAVGLTFGTMFALLMAYQSGLIRATENFKLGVCAATGGIALLYLVSFGLSLFSIRMPYIHEAGLIGIGFSVFVVIIAALNLVLDFDFIEDAAAKGAPKYMEWYAAFGLMVTLVWLYVEILRLLAKLNSRND